MRKHGIGHNSRANALTTDWKKFDVYKCSVFIHTRRLIPFLPIKRDLKILLIMSTLDL